MSQNTKRVALVAGAVTLLSFGIGKIFDTRCESSCLVAATKASGNGKGDFNFDFGNGHIIVNDDDEGGPFVKEPTLIKLPAEAFERVEFSGVASDVVIKSGTALEAKASEYHSDKGWIVKADGKTLKIDLTEKGPEHLELTLPVAVKGLDLTTVSGDVKVGDKLALEQLSLKSTSGDISLGSWPSRELSVKSVSGDVVGKASGTSPKEIDINSVSADVTLELPTAFERLKSQTVSGDMRLKLAAKPNFEYRMHSISGDFHGIPGGSLKEGIADREMTGKLGEAKGPRLEFESISGDFQLTL